MLRRIRNIQPLIIPPIHSSGWPFIVGMAFAALILSLAWDFFGYVGLLTTVWMFYFFRNPVRVTPDREGLVVSPSAGHVRSIHVNVALPKALDPEHQMGKDFTRITISTDLLDSHVTRTPVTGHVVDKHVHTGAIVNAEFDKAGEENDHVFTLIEAPYKEKPHHFALVQIGESLARNIINTAEPKTQCTAGETIGFIRFLGRTELYLPKGVSPLVIEGQTLVEGETVIADLASKEKQRIGIAH